MWEVRWRRGFGPPLIAAAAALFAHGVANAAGGPVAGVIPGPGSVGTCVATPDGLGRSHGAAWYRRTELADAAGHVRAYSLSGGTLAHGTALRVSLPAESFVAGPFGDRVVYGRDDGRASEIRVVRLADGCDERVATSANVARGATVSPSGGNLFVHLVDRRSRADLGVWRRSLHGRGEAQQMLPGLVDPGDGPFGRTFGTFFTWSDTGRTLAVQSCGAVACRTRLLDPETGRWTMDASPDQGELIGLTDTERYAYAACHGLPCPVVAIEPDGRRRAVVASAGVATVAVDGGVARIAYEAPAPDGGVSIHVRSAAGGRDRVMADQRSGLHLAWPARWAGTAVTVVPGRVLATPDGRWSSLDVLRRAPLLSTVGLPRTSLGKALP